MTWLAGSLIQSHDRDIVTNSSETAVGGFVTSRCSEGKAEYQVSASATGSNRTQLLTLLSTFIYESLAKEV